MADDMGGFAVVGGQKAAVGPPNMGGFSPVPVKPSADLGGFTIVGGAQRRPAPPAPAPKPAAAAPSPKPAARPRSYLEPAPTGLAKVAHDFREDTRPSIEKLKADAAGFPTDKSRLGPLANAAQLGLDAFDVAGGAIKGTAGRALFPHDNNITGYNEEHRQMVGDVGSMLLPVEGLAGAAKPVAKAAGAVVDGFKIIGRSAATEERAARAVRDMTGRKPVTGPPGKPYVAGLGPRGSKVYAQPAGVPLDAHTTELFDALDAEIKRLSPASGNRPLAKPVRSNAVGFQTHAVGFQTHDASGRSLIAWALDRTGVPPDFLDQAKTVRHEAIHALRADGFFTPQEWAALEKQAKAENWMERYKIHDRYRGYTDTHKLEEAVADHFAYWRGQRDAALRQKGLTAHATRAFQRLSDLLDAVGAHVRQRFGKDITTEQLFKQIDRGKVGRRDLSGLTPDELKARQRNPNLTTRPKPEAPLAEHSGPPGMGGFEPIREGQGSSAHPTDNVIGTEKDPVERVDNALYRLGNHDTASKLEAKQYLDDLPEVLKDPKVQERLTDALEERLKDPNAPIPADLQDAYNAYKPWADRQRAAINEIRAIKDKAGIALDYDEDIGYVPRYPVGHSSGFDEGALHLPGDKQRSTLAGGRSSLRTKSKSEFNRQFHVVTDADGREAFVEGPVEKEDPLGRPYAKVRQATISEIEKATGGDVEYHKNALVNTMVRALEDEKTLRNLKVLEELKTSLKKQGLAYQKFWHDAGGVRRWNKKREIPEGMVALHHIPQLEGWYFDKRVAEAFQDYHPLPSEPEGDVLQKINRLATASLFITPFPHIGNVGAMWITGRGWDWMNPGAYPRAMKAGAQAMQEVLTLGPRYRQMLREGSALRAADDATRNFHDAMLKAAGHEIETNPQTFKALAKAFGVGQMTPADVVRTIYNTSHRMLWTANDVLMLQRQFELEAKGMKTRDAIKEAETWIANYRVPPQVMKSRAASRLLTNNHAVVFGRYEYGKWKALGEMAKPFLGKATGAERLDRLGKIMALGLMTYFVYPKMDAMLAKATGNPDAQVRRGGSEAIVDALSPGEKQWPERMGSLLSLSPVMQAPAEILNNRYGFTGQPIIEPGSSPAGMAAQGAEGASQYVVPASSALQALQPGGLPQSLGALGGLKIPAKDKETGYRKRDKFQKSEARRRERRDPLTQDLKEMMP